jgi:REP element-mobilizing transposase RayT
VSREAATEISRGCSDREAGANPRSASKIKLALKGRQKMSTYLSLHYHVVFSTKQRRPFISAAWLPRLHEYLGGAVKRLGGKPEIVGGIADHVHLLMGLNATHCLADFMRELKSASSVWVKREIGESGFGWQDGYSAFTVSASGLPSVRKYISAQAVHHLHRDFREEMIALLDKSGVDYDPRYLF